MNISYHKFLLSTFFLISLILINHFRSAAQNAPPMEWQKTLGGSGDDIPLAICQNNEGNFMVAGSTDSEDGDVTASFGNDDLWLTLLSPNGELIWQKSLGGSSSEEAQAIVPLENGDYVIGGYTSSDDGDATDNHGKADFWILRIDGSGNIIWQKSFGGSEVDKISSIIQTSDGGFIAVGSTNSNGGDVSGNHGGNDYWIVKISSEGELQWQKCAGGSDDDYGQSIVQISDGSFTCIGYSLSNDGDVTGNHGTFDCWMVNMDSDGNLQWEKSLGGSGHDLVRYMRSTPDGGYIFSGHTDSPDGDVTGNFDSDDYWVVRLNSAAEIQWAKCFGGYKDDCSYGLLSTSDGGFIVSGHSFSSDGDKNCHLGGPDYWVFRLDADGNMLWQECMGGYNLPNEDYPLDMIQSIDEGFVIVGKSNSNDGDKTVGYGQFDYWVVKLSCEFPDTVYLDADNDGFGNLLQSIVSCPGVVAGYVSNSLDCDDNNASINPSASEFCNNLDDNCNGDIDDDVIFTTYYADTDGDNYGDPNNSISNCVPVNGYVPDSTNCNDTDPNINPSATEIANNNIDDDCDGDIDEFGVGISGLNSQSTNLSVFPNPTDGVFELLLNLPASENGDVKIEVISVFGQVMISQNTALDKGKLQERIQLNDFADGVYLVKVTQGSRIFGSQINLQK